jgi:ornithine carbamoyltransferase
MPEKNDFLDLDLVSKGTLREILQLAYKHKSLLTSSAVEKPLDGKTLAMMFEKPSTRTRVSFEVGIRQLGGHSIILSPKETQFGHGETIADTARVLSRFVDIIMLRTDDPEKLLDLAKYSSVPVINGLTDLSHPCQIMADIMTLEENLGPIKGKKIAWVGDGNNVANSFIQASAQFDFSLSLACPPQLQPSQKILKWAVNCGADVVIGDDPSTAVTNADCVVTDTWVSMHNKVDSRVELLEPFRVTKELMNKAKNKALFMHCLPAHRGEEVEAEVIDGIGSVVWDEAENRLHAQKGILLWCLKKGD